MNVDDLVLLRPEEAARRLSVSRSTVYELMQSGELPSIKLGKSRRVPASALEVVAQRWVRDTAFRRMRPSETGEA